MGRFRRFCTAFILSGVAASVGAQSVIQNSLPQAVQATDQSDTQQRAQKSTQPVWKQLKTLINMNKSEQAYELAMTLLELHEGEPDFDYYYGMAAIDTGRIAEGTFALERVLFHNPNFQAAKLELARGYYLLKQYPLARQHFKAVLDVAPPASVLERINTFMLLMEKAENELEPSVLAYLELASGHDNNVNFAPSSENFNSPTLGEGVLSEDGKAQSDWYNDTLAGAGYYYPLSKQTTLYARADLSDHNIIGSHAFDSFTYTLQAGAIHKPNNDNVLSGQWIHQQYSVDGSRYRELNGLAGSWMRVLNVKSSLQFGASYLNFVYNDLNNKDAEEYNLSLGYNRQVPLFGVSLLQARLSMGQDKPDEDNDIAESGTERDFWGMSLTHKVPVGPKWLITSTLAYLNSEYGGDDLIFQKTREDDSVNFEVTADWRWDEHWQFSASTGWREQDSNVEIYDHDRAYAQVGIRYEYY